ncbi:flippase [Acidovorax soli]|uniref:flippase n=1 Tax=Acidovorax soli TaxID=592050 RepID=UPI0032B1CB04
MSLKRNTIWNLAGAGLPLLLGAVTIPYLIKNIGVEAFGILTLVWALIGYFSLFDFGLGRALTQQVAAMLSARQYMQLPNLIKTGLWFTAVTGIIGGMILAALADQLAIHWLKVSVLLQPSTQKALIVAAIGIPLTTMTTGLRGILEAYEDFKVVNLLRIGLGAANFGLPALSVMFIGNSLIWMVVSLIAARAIVFFAHGWLVYRKLSDDWRASRFNKSTMRNLLSFSLWMTVSNIVSPLMVSADRFVISTVLGASMVAYYTVPFEVLIRILIVPGALTSVLFPRLAAVMATDWPEAKRLYRKSLKIIALALFPICILIALTSKWTMALWLGRDFSEISWPIVSIMAVGVLLNGLASLPFAAIQATGDARTTACLHILELAIYIPALFFCLKFFGLIGAAIAWSLRVGVDLIVLLICAKRRKL